MANPIYAEVIPRELVLPLEATLAGSVDPAWYVQADGSLDLEGLPERVPRLFPRARRVVDRALRACGGGSATGAACVPKPNTVALRIGSDDSRHPIVGCRDSGPRWRSLNLLIFRLMPRGLA